MKLTVQSVHFDADKKLLEFIQKKADKLDMFYDRIISGEVIMKIEKSPDDKNKVFELKVHLPGQDLFAKEKCKSFEEATDLAVSSIERQLMRFKGKVSPQSVDRETFFLDEMAD